MEKHILPIPQYIPQISTDKAGVSFKYFIDFIKKKIAEKPGLRTTFYKLILHRFQEHPELYNEISLDEVGKYEEILELIASSVTPLIDDEKESLWALATPFSYEIFYGSDAFYESFEKHVLAEAKNAMLDSEEKLKFYQEFQYAFILEKVFGFKSEQKKELIQPVIDTQTGLYRYYRINFDLRFVEVKIKDAVSEFEIGCVQACNGFEKALETLDQTLSLDMFEATGFSIITLTDVTEQQALEQLGKVIVTADQTQPENSFQHVNKLLKTIMGSDDFHFGLMPFPSINNRPAIIFEVFPFSIIVKASLQAAVPKEITNPFVKQFLKSPEILSYQVGEASKFPAEIEQAFRAYGITSYALFPVMNKNQAIGMLEVCKFGSETPLNMRELTKLKPALPLLTQLLNLMLQKFDGKINKIIKDKFTSIQPSVQWRFREAAWHYLRNNFRQQIYNSSPLQKNEVVDKIIFNDLYPLYGAIDIRDSSIERNKALHSDLCRQLNQLVEVLDGIVSEAHAQQIQDIMDSCSNWLQLLSGFFSTDQEIQLHDFLWNDAHQLLSELRQLSRDVSEKVQPYWDAIHEKTGIAFENRRQLEASMQLINSALNQYLDQAQESLQKIYPFYFERFRTDGIEYDIYIGQSLAPKVPFKPSYLQKFRAWQIQSMGEIVRLMHDLLPQMAIPSYTTQLIFAHPQTIDISFRNDEKRFDVEGTYNIRYHIIKKRIDKVRILDTEERLTQPGKIALVYFNKKDVEEYIDIIRKLQQQGVLLDDLEFLELEELQGVSGLKALRVGVIDYPKDKT